MDDSRPAGLRAGAVVLAATGGSLALVGLTLPWVAVQPRMSSPSPAPVYLVQLADLNAVVGPAAALVLIFVGVGAALCLGPAHPLSSALWWSTALTAITGAVGFLFLTVYSIVGSALLVRDPITYSPKSVEVGNALPSTGCLLYLGGLTMVAAGVAGAEVARRYQPSPAQPSPAQAEALATMRRAAQRVTLAIGLVLAAVSLWAPWSRVEPTRAGSSELAPVGAGSADVQVWFVGYRVSVFLCLALIVLALLRPVATTRLRVAGLLATSAVTIALVMGYLMLWQTVNRLISDVTSLSYATLRPGPGLPLGILTMIVLALSFALLPSAPEAPADPEPERR